MARELRSRWLIGEVCKWTLATRSHSFGGVPLKVVANCRTPRTGSIVDTLELQSRRQASFADRSAFDGSRFATCDSMRFRHSLGTVVTQKLVVKK